jgi:ribosomal protein S18 acetylase RimI-like enzyme
MNGFDATLLSRIEDAGLNASAPPQQRWMDGWLLRFSPAKAKRARCINPLAEGRLPLARKLELAAAAYQDAGLPLMLRITPFSQPPGLDDALAELGFARFDDTRVMVCADLAATVATRSERAPPPGTHWAPSNADDFARAVGALRGTPIDQALAHAERLRHSPVPYHGQLLRRDGDGAVLACGQFAVEADLAGLYDVHTLADHRGQGLASLLCERMLSLSAAIGARSAYLQVESENGPARHIYGRLGFVDAYAYHYRQAP